MRGRAFNEIPKGSLRGFHRRRRGENILRLDGGDVLGGYFDKATFHLQPVFVAEELVTRNVKPLAAAQHKVFRANWGGGCRQRRRKQQNRESHAHEAASRRANCSMATATPFSSFVPVSCQPKFFSSGTPLPITTGIPANDNISRSL